MIKNIQKINDYLWEIPKNYRQDMLVSARIFANSKMLDDIVQDKSLEQLVNVATLPGIQKYALAMPDIHEGYGFPVGGIAATEYPNGVISPGGIGYDINCGVRLLQSEKSVNEISEKFIEKLSWEIFKRIPSGVGKGGNLKLDAKALDNVLENGIQWAIDNGYAQKDDDLYIESEGVLKNADAKAVSARAKKRGIDQLGTMGAGNHFVEVGKVEEIFNSKTAESFNFFKGQITVLIHTGSRGLGHQVATDYIKLILGAMAKYKINLPDRELAAVPFVSPEGRQYFNAMAAAANFAWVNRQLITLGVREAWNNIFGNSGGNLDIFYDVAHNLAKIEEHNFLNGDIWDLRNPIYKKMIVHRKGATRAFGPEHSDLPKKFQKSGQPVIIPGSMGTASYILLGDQKSMEQAFGSSCHGAGRRMSRHSAKKIFQGNELKQELKRAGIIIQSASLAGIAEEAPRAYKDIDDVVNIVHNAGIAKKFIKLKPLAVIKG